MNPQRDRHARIKEYLERTVDNVLRAVQLDDRGSHSTRAACAQAEIALASLRDEMACLERDARVVAETRTSYEDRVSLH